MYQACDSARIERAMMETDSLRNRVAGVEDKRSIDYEEIRRISDITALFEEEREEVGKLVDRTTYLENNMVMLEQYRKDKKAMRAEGEMVKEEVRKMIDHALTP